MMVVRVYRGIFQGLFKVSYFFLKEEMKNIVRIRNSRIKCKEMLENIKFWDMKYIKGIVRDEIRKVGWGLGY